MNRLPLVVAGLVGLVAGGAIGMAAFDGDTKTETATTVVTQENTRTKTVRRGGGGGGGVKTVTRTRTVTTPATSSAPPGESGANGPVRTVRGEQTFSGKDTKQLGTLDIKRNSTLEWTNNGQVFAVISQTQLHVSSTKKKGSVRMFKGSYPQFRVAAIGRWTLKITPR